LFFCLEEKKGELILFKRKKKGKREAGSSLVVIALPAWLCVSELVK